MKSKVTTRGQVSIPSEIRKKFHIEPESKIEWIVEDNVIKVVPLPKDLVAAFRRCFEKRAEIIEADLSTAPLGCSSDCVTEGDARKLIAVASRKKFRLCVTSPPYLNSFDYSDIYRPELFLGGFVDSNKSLMDLRLKTIRSHVQASWENPKKDRFGTLFKNCIDKIRETADGLWNSRIPTMVQAYFEDMETILRGLHQRAHKRASIWLVVSTSAYAGIEVPVDLIIAEIGQRNGWFLREIGVLRYLRSSSQHVKHVDEIEKKAVPLRESVIILDATKYNGPKNLYMELN